MNREWAIEAQKRHNDWWMWTRVEDIAEFLDLDCQMLWKNSRYQGA